MNEIMVHIQIEPLDEGGYLATSDDLEGLIVQGRTVAETMEIAQDVARKLIEAHLEHGDPLPPAISSALSRKEEKVTVFIPVVVSEVSSV